MLIYRLTYITFICKFIQYHKCVMMRRWVDQTSRNPLLPLSFSVYDADPAPRIRKTWLKKICRRTSEYISTFSFRLLFLNISFRREPCRVTYTRNFLDRLVFLVTLINMWIQNSKLHNFKQKMKSALTRKDNNNCDSYTVVLVIKCTIREICVWKNKQLNITIWNYYTAFS